MRVVAVFKESLWLSAYETTSAHPHCHYNTTKWHSKNTNPTNVIEIFLCHGESVHSELYTHWGVNNEQ